MKRNLLFLLMAFITLSFVACDDETKENDDNQNGNGTITIEWATNPDFDTVAIESNMAGKAVIEIKAEAGIKSLQLNINSPALTDGILEAVGLSTSVDLATLELDADLADALAGVPFGDQVKDQTAVTFDVSNLVPMILALPNKEGDHVFSIVVADNNNKTAEKDLVFNYTEPANLSVSDINLWANTAIVTAKGLSADAKVQYREQGAEAWQEATANNDGTYTIAPVWNENTNEAGLKVYTPAEGTGVWIGKTYEYRILEGETETFSSTFTPEGTGDIIPNGDMSAWSLKDGSLPYPNAEGDTLWDSGNNSMVTLFGNPHLCDEDESLGCAKLTSASTLGILASGNLFTGKFVMAGTYGTVHFGQPYTYTARPSALKLRYHATIGDVNSSNSTAGVKIEEGQPDIAVIYVAIIDWSERHSVISGLAGENTGAGSWNPATMEGLDAEKEKVIAYGLYDITTSTAGEDLVDLTIPLNFYDKDAAAPQGNYTLVISCSCSKYGDYLNGCSSNVMYVDDFQWVY